jgi:hypothetical protein
MSKQCDSPISIVTGEAINAFCRVKISGATVIYADAGAAGIGTVQEYTASGAMACIRLHGGGTHKVRAAGTFSAGATLYGAADGEVDDTVVGSPLGYALEAATAAHDIIEMVGALNETDSSALEMVGNSARGRAATAMPTEEIWKNFNLCGMRANPFTGSLLETDFSHGEKLVDSIFKDTSSTIIIYPGATGVGEVRLFTTADNEAAEIQFTSCPITVTGGAPWAFEARIKQSVLTDAKCGWFAGLMVGTAFPTGDLIVDAGTLQTEGSLGFQCKEADGDKVDLVYDTTGQTQNEHDDDYVTQVADTYFTVGLYYDGATIQGYLNGVATGTAISAVDIAVADFPAALILVPTIALKAAHADDFTVTVDWIRVAQGTA